MASINTVEFSSNKSFFAISWDFFIRLTEVGGKTKLFGEVYVNGNYEQLKLL